jgi:hypothetical protein
MPGHDPCTTILDFVGPGGERITPSKLPPRGLKHCSVREKVLVVTAVRHGMLTFDEACERYDLSLDEFLTWLAVAREEAARKADRTI